MFGGPVKPPPFEYVVAGSVDHACELLDADEDAKVLAGGQSLIPLLSLRLSSPTLLVDISRIPELREVHQAGDTLAIGALVRHEEVERSPVVREAAPLLSAAAAWVAHPQIRNSGTFGGAVAHSDSAAEFPAALLATGGTIVTLSSAGERRITSRDFFGTHFQTALQHGELVVRVEIPAADNQSRWGFSEYARRKGDYAIGGAAVCARVDPQGRCTSVAAGLIAAGAGPTLATGLDEELINRQVDEVAVERAATRVAAVLTPESNVHGTSEYRRAVLTDQLRRALRQTFDLEDDSFARRSA